MNPRSWHLPAVSHGAQMVLLERALENYMPIVTRKKWDTGEVGMKVEVFAIAGCDPVTEGRLDEGGDLGGIGKALVDTTHDANAKMVYTWYEQDIVQRYGVVLEGWTAPRFVNPSELSTSLSILHTLLDDVKSEASKFRKLTPAEAEACKEKWDADVAAGRATAKSRAPRNDIGVPRKCTRPDNDEEPEDDNEDAEHDDHDNDKLVHPPPKKRACKATPAAAKTTTPKSRVRKSATTPKAAAPKKAPHTLAQQDDNTTHAALTWLKEKWAWLSKATVDDGDEEENHVPAVAEAGNAAQNADVTTWPQRANVACGAAINSGGGIKAAARG
ncbi:hypothetical protein B0H10DRAFT_1945855 [Mycena sp. CBHHK59/15]|nr:hypothetical protein B0H10DRAFT_1945855 [Mycena sp. CBHHK59/15]